MAQELIEILLTAQYTMKSDEIKIMCPICGKPFWCCEEQAIGQNPPACSSGCEEEKIQQEWEERMADLNYRSGYDYACRYHE